MYLDAVHMRRQRRYLRLVDWLPRAHVIVQPQQRLIVCLQRLSFQNASPRCLLMFWLHGLMHAEQSRSVRLRVFCLWWPLCRAALESQWQSERASTSVKSRSDSPRAKRGCTNSASSSDTSRCCARRCRSAGSSALPSCAPTSAGDSKRAAPAHSQNHLDKADSTSPGYSWAGVLPVLKRSGPAHQAWPWERRVWRPPRRQALALALRAG